MRNNVQHVIESGSTKQVVLGTVAVSKVSSPGASSTKAGATHGQPQRRTLKSASVIRKIRERLAKLW